MQNWWQKSWIRKRLLIAPPPLKSPDEPEIDVEGLKNLNRDVDMTDAAAMRAIGKGETIEPIDID